jgi:hypothetical protein
MPTLLFKKERKITTLLKPLNSLRKGAIFLVICFQILSLNAQELEQVESKKTILIVPYNRFEFHTEFTLDELAEANGVNKYAVFDLYQDNVLNILATHSCTAFNFKVINTVNLHFLMYRVSYQSNNKKGYYASNLDRLKTDDLKRIMLTYDADYILFINWYHIKNEVILNLGKASRGRAFSSHYVDFDVYDRTKNIITWKHKAKIDNLDTEESLLRKGLKITDLKEGVEAFATYCCELIGEGAGKQQGD